MSNAAKVTIPTSGDNGKSVIYNSTSDAWTLSVPLSIVNVKSYGALGDGSTNDSTAVTAAIAAIPATGGVLYFPAGTYYLPISGANRVSGLPNNTIVQGAGEDATILKAETGSATAAGAMICSAVGSYPYNMTVRDLTVQMPGGTGGFITNAIEHLGGSSGSLRVEGVKITGTCSGGIVIDGPYAGNGSASVIACEVERCDFTLSSGTGIIASGQVGSRLSARDCRFWSYATAGTNLDHGLYIYHDVETIISGCRFDSNLSTTSGGFAIQFYGGTAVASPRKVVNCHFSANSYNGIVCPSTGPLEILGCSFVSPTSGFSLTGFNGGNIDIIGCRFSGTGGKVYADQQTTGSTAWFSRCVFESNTVSSLFVASLSAGRLRFSHCEFTALASTVTLATLSNGATAWQNCCLFNNLSFPSSGTTAQRPPAPQAGIGGEWYDTTLGYGIWSTGATTVWHNGAGASV